jgi:hypothetical protein
MDERAKKFIAKEILILTGSAIAFVVILILTTFEQGYYITKGDRIKVEVSKIEDRLDKIDSIIDQSVLPSNNEPDLTKAFGIPQHVVLPDIDLSKDTQMQIAPSTSRLPDLKKIGLEKDTLQKRIKELNEHKSKIDIFLFDNFDDMFKCLLYCMLLLMYCLRPVYYVLKWSFKTVRTQ